MLWWNSKGNHNIPAQVPLKYHRKIAFMTIMKIRSDSLSLFIVLTAPLYIGKRGITKESTRRQSDTDL